MEFWIPIPDNPGYDASDEGRIRSWRAWRGQPVPRILAGGLNTGGYIQFTINGRVCRAHQLVALAWLGPCPEGQEVRHNNDVKTDNHAANLEYGTRSQNQLDMVRNGIHPQSSKTHCRAGHELSGDNLRLAGRKRVCRACIAVNSALYRARP
jgi:hypothetical protein